MLCDVQGQAGDTGCREAPWTLQVRLEGKGAGGGGSSKLLTWLSSGQVPAPLSAGEADLLRSFPALHCTGPAARQPCLTAARCILLPSANITTTFLLPEFPNLGCKGFKVLAL